MDGTVVAAAGVRALAVARRYLGVRESPPGSNRTPFGAWYGEDGVPWCAIFVSYCFEQGAGVVLGRGHRGATPRGVASVIVLEDWLRDSRQWWEGGEPQRGDLALFNWDGGVPDHVGIVERRLSGGRFATIEGNTAVGNDSNGGEVMRRIRRLSSVDGFGRLP
jgi:cell wall-associated NlpC family hydrolase